MPRLRRLSADALFVTLPRTLNGVSAVVVNLWAVQHLEPGAYGVFAFCSACLLLFDGLVCSALDLGVMRRDASQRQGTRGFTPVERSAIAMKALVAAVCICAALLFGEYVGWIAFERHGGRWLFTLAALGGGGLLVLHSIQVHFQVTQRFRNYGGVELAHTLARLALVAAAVMTGMVSPLTMLAAYALAPALVSAAFARWFWRQRGAQPWFDDREVRSLASFAGTALLSLGLGAIIARLDLFFLGFLSAPAEMGIYGAALIVALIPEFLGFYLAPVLTPRIGLYLEQRKMSHLMWRCQLVLGVAYVVLLLGGLLLVAPLMAMVLPPEYAASINVVQVLLPGTLTGLFLFPLTFNFVLLTSPRTLIVIDCLTLPLLVIGYAVMARQGGALGVAWATCIYKITKAIVVQAIAAHGARQADRCGSAQTDAGPGTRAATGSSAPQGAW